MVPLLASNKTITESGKESSGSAFDLPFEPTTMRENQLRYASTLIEPYDMALLQADWIKASFGLSIDELPHYRRMIAESRSCVYDFDDGMRLIVVPELWPSQWERSETAGSARSVIRASGFDHPAVAAENSTWEPDGDSAAEIGRRFSQLIGVSMDRLMFVGLTPLGLPCCTSPRSMVLKSVCLPVTRSRMRSGCTGRSTERA